MTMTEYRARITGRRNRLIARAIAERDGWLCRRCRLPIDPLLSPMLPGGLTIGHVLPFAHGGSNDPTNLAAEHRRCNLAAGDRPERPPAVIAKPHAAENPLTEDMTTVPNPVRRAEAALRGWDAYREALAGRHEGPHVPDRTLNGECGPCVGAVYGTEVEMAEYLIPALRDALTPKGDTHE